MDSTLILPVTTTKLWQKLWPSLLAAGFVALLLSMRHAGFMLYLVVLVWIFWVPYSIHVLVRHPERRALQAARMVIWVVAAGGVAAVHAVRHDATRGNAKRIVAAIRDFRDATGRYPSSLQDIGITESQRRELLGVSNYHVDKGGRPSLVYSATFEPFSTYAYDFDKRSWEYFGD